MTILWIIGCVFAGVIIGFVLGVYVQARRPMDFYDETWEEFDAKYNGD